jgi:hypothetical protein
VAYHEQHDPDRSPTDAELRADLDRRLNKGSKQRGYQAALLVAAFSLLMAFIVTGVVIYSSRDLSERLAEFQLQSCQRGNGTREQIKLGQRALHDLIVVVQPTLTGPIAVKFQQARSELEQGLSRLDDVDCDLVVPR